jgi:hypothetical protein
MKTFILSVIASAIILLFAAMETASAQVTWTLSQSVDSVDFHYSIQECEGDSVVFLKFVNNKY